MKSRFILFITRLALGWVMFYAGITKIMNPNWSAAGYLKNAKTFPEIFNWFLNPDVLPIVNFINEWGLLFLGVSLILGVGMRISGILGALLMMLYYFPSLDFPMIGTTSYIVDEHVVYALLLVYLAITESARYMGLGSWFVRTFASDRPFLRKLLA